MIRRRKNDLSHRRDSCPAQTGWRDYIPAILLLFIGLFGIAIAMLMPSGRDGQYAVVTPPWYSEAKNINLIQQAGGGITNMGGPKNIIIVHSDNPSFLKALYSAGAWLVIDPVNLRGCIGQRTSPSGEST